MRCSETLASVTNGADYNMKRGPEPEAPPRGMLRFSAGDGAGLRAENRGSPPLTFR